MAAQEKLAGNAPVDRAGEIDVAMEKTAETTAPVRPIVRLSVFGFQQQDGEWLIAAFDKNEAIQYLVEAAGYATAVEMRADGWNLRGRKLSPKERVSLRTDDGCEYSLPAYHLAEHPGLVARPQL